LSDVPFHLKVAVKLTHPPPLKNTDFDQRLNRKTLPKSSIIAITRILMNYKWSTNVRYP